MKERVDEDDLQVQGLSDGKNGAGILDRKDRVADMDEHCLKVSSAGIKSNMPIKHQNGERLCHLHLNTHLHASHVLVLLNDSEFPGLVMLFHACTPLHLLCSLAGKLSPHPSVSLPWLCTSALMVSISLHSLLPYQTVKSRSHPLDIPCPSHKMPCTVGAFYVRWTGTWVSEPREGQMSTLHS